MGHAAKKSQEQWLFDWLASIASGPNKMSSRKLTSIQKRGGNLTQVASAAKKLKVHLVLLEDDEGHQVVVGSRKPFKVIA